MITNAFLVPRTRVELARRKPALPPQSSVSTNFTTWASKYAVPKNSGTKVTLFSFHARARNKNLKKQDGFTPRGAPIRGKIPKFAVHTFSNRNEPILIPKV